VVCGEAAVKRHRRHVPLDLDPVAAEMEADWERRLGPKRFAQLRNLLLELQQPA
jgi:hypothetical protein